MINVDRWIIILICVDVRAKEKSPVRKILFSPTYCFEPQSVGPESVLQQDEYDYGQG